MKNNKVLTIAGLAILLALEIVLNIVSSYIVIGTVQINLGLIPIIIAALIYKELGGAIIGVANGVMIILSPATSVFISVTMIGTIITCILKTGLAGVACALLFRLFKNKNERIATILSSIIVPILNSALFILFVFIFFKPLYAPLATEAGASLFSFVLTGVISINFLVELLVSVAFSYGIYRLYVFFEKKYNNK